VFFSQRISTELQNSGNRRDQLPIVGLQMVFRNLDVDHILMEGPSTMYDT